MREVGASVGATIEAVAEEVVTPPPARSARSPSRFNVRYQGSSAMPDKGNPARSELSRRIPRPPDPPSSIG
ncbi:MAG TPA: hypothetical protein VND67_08980 [Acidimicrobiales bacterium]|nr:hypothetical protein [Acidimicrobiales bacterium]